MIPNRYKGALFWGAFFIVGCSQKASIKKPLDSSQLVTALSQARQPALAIAAVKAAAEQGDACHYAEVAARAALDANLHALVPSLVRLPPQPCPRKSILDGERAEGLARAGMVEQAGQLAKELLAATAENGYAELALAKVAFDANAMTECFEHADKAFKRGRGAEAQRFMARSSLARGKYKESEAAFQQVSAANPDDAEAAFSGAVCSDKLGNYHRAREGFLQTLRIDPTHAEARKYLVLLTNRAGAKDESKHHLKKLAEVNPALASELEEALEAPPNDRKAKSR